MPDVAAGLLREEPAVLEQLVEELGGGALAAAARAGRRRSPARTPRSASGPPRLRPTPALRRCVRASSRYAVRSLSSRRAWFSCASRPGEPEQAAPVVARLDDLRLEPQPDLAAVADELDLLDVEAERVQALQPLLERAAVAGREDLVVGQLCPELLVARADVLGELDGIVDDVALELRGEVVQLADEVLLGDREVVRRAGRRRAAPRARPVSASTRYAESAPASRRKSAFESEQSPQKKPARCRRTSSSASAARIDASGAGSTAAPRISRYGSEYSR